MLEEVPLQTDYSLARYLEAEQRHEMVALSISSMSVRPSEGERKIEG